MNSKPSFGEEAASAREDPVGPNVSMLQARVAHAEGKLDDFRRLADKLRLRVDKAERLLADARQEAELRRIAKAAGEAKLEEFRRLVRKLQAEIVRTQKQLRLGEKAIGNVLSLLGLEEIIPAEALRLHVGTSTTAANYYAQGANSARTVVETFGREPGGLVLDWGCGSGRTYNWLRLLPAWRDAYRGCDVDRDAIAWLRSRGIDAVDVCQTEPPLPYEAETFTGLFCFSVLTHIHPSSHGAWYDEIARVLRPGGRAFITTQGEAVIASGRMSDEHARRAFLEQGWAYQTHDGHYKDAALVSGPFTSRLLGERFARVEPIPGNYNGVMEAYVVTK